MEQRAQGFVEVTGYVPAIEVADVMAKTAEVTVVMAHKVDGPRVCVIVEGDVAACKAAVEAGKDLCQSKGTLIGANVIPRPEQGAPELYKLLDAMKARKAAKKAERLARLAKIGQPAARAAAPKASAPKAASKASPAATAKKSAPKKPAKK